MPRKTHEDESFFLPRRSKSALNMSSKKNDKFIPLNNDIYSQQQQLQQNPRRSKSAMSNARICSSKKKHLPPSHNDVTCVQHHLQQQDVLNRGKNRLRHLTCMTPYRPSAILSDFKKKSLRRTGVEYHVERQQIPLSSNSSFHSWENVVLPQLSKETAFFIKHRFMMENKTTTTKSSENNIKQYHKGRENSNVPCKRLFDLQYTDSSEPDYFILL